MDMQVTGIMPVSRPFPSKFYGKCSWSGLQIKKFDTIRGIAQHGSGITNIKDMDVYYVHERFVNAACDPTWIRLSGLDLKETDIAEGASFYLLDKYGKESLLTKEDGRYKPFGSWSKGRALGHFQSTYKAAVGFKPYVVFN